MREEDWDDEKKKEGRRGEGEEGEQGELTLPLWMRYYSGSFCDCPKLSAGQSETKEQETSSLSSTPANHSREEGSMSNLRMDIVLWLGNLQQILNQSGNESIPKNLVWK